MGRNVGREARGDTATGLLSVSRSRCAAPAAVPRVGSRTARRQQFRAWAAVPRVGSRKEGPPTRGTASHAGRDGKERGTGGPWRHRHGPPVRLAVALRGPGSSSARGKQNRAWAAVPRVVSRKDGPPTRGTASHAGRDGKERGTGGPWRHRHGPPVRLAIALRAALGRSSARGQQERAWSAGRKDLLRAERLPNPGAMGRNAGRTPAARGQGVGVTVHVPFVWIAMTPGRSTSYDLANAPESPNSCGRPEVVNTRPENESPEPAGR